MGIKLHTCLTPTLLSTWREKEHYIRFNNISTRVKTDHDVRGCRVVVRGGTSLRGGRYSYVTVHNVF